MLRAAILAAGLLAGCALPTAALTPSIATLDETGAPTDEPWGQWSAEAGAVDVISPRLLHVQGHGVWSVELLDGAFVGVEDPRWSVPFEGNVRLGALRGGSLAWARPGARMTLDLDEHPDGALVAFEIASVGSPLPAQAYLSRYQVVPP